MSDVKSVNNKYKRVVITRLDSKEHFYNCESNCDCTCAICGEKLIAVTTEEDRRIFATLPYIQIEQRNRIGAHMRMHESCFRAFTVMCMSAVGGTDVSAHEMASSAKAIDIVITPRSK